jgi:hypothetical protein
MDNNTDIGNAIFNKTNGVFLLWFLAIYIFSYFLLGTFLNKNNDNRLCIKLRKQFDRISALEKLYNSEIENISNFKESLKNTPCIYYEAKATLVNYNKKKKKLQKQILFEEHKLINKRYTYIILFRKIDV